MSLVFLEKIFGALYGNTIATNQPVDLSGSPSVALPSGTTINGAAAAPSTITSNSANAFTVGPNGTTNPAFNVDASASSAATGLNIVSAASGSGISLAATGGTNEAITISSKGTGAINLKGGNTNGTFTLTPLNGWSAARTVQVNFGDTSTFIKNTNGGALLISTNSTTGIQIVDSAAGVSVNSADAASFAVGPNGATTPGFQVDASASTAITGFKITMGATGVGPILSSIGDTNTAFVIQSKGTAQVQIKPGTDSTTAVTFANAAGTLKMRFDTTNGRMRVGDNSAPASTLDVGGDVTVSAHNIITDTTTGMKIATATSQKLGFFNATPVVQQTQGATVTNNITSGGSANTLANYTDLTVYANDSAAIRNNQYQMGQTLKTIVDGLRTLGLFS